MHFDQRCWFIILHTCAHTCALIRIYASHRHYIKRKNETELFEVTRADFDIILDRFPILKARLLAVSGAVAVKAARALEV